MTTVLRAEGARPYAVTAGDRLWLSRAVQAEGPPETHVAQALVNGFMLSRSRGYTKSLGEYVRAYAQPVNPRWFKGGDKYLESMDDADTDEERTLRERKAYVREHVHSVRMAFSPVVRVAVERALAMPPEMPRATDYAAHYVVRKSPWLALTDARAGVNRFWARPRTEGWAGYVVDAAVLGTVLLLCLGLGFGAYYFRKG